MFTSIRARIVALCVAIVVVALAATAAAAALQRQAGSLASAVTQFKLD